MFIRLTMILFFQFPLSFLFDARLFLLERFQLGHQSAARAFRRFILLDFGFVGFQPFEEFLFIRRLAQYDHRQDADQTRDEIVIVQTGRVRVENEEEHDRHEIHHVFHERHLLLLVHRILHLHGDNRIEQARCGEQDAEDAQVIADDREVRSPANDVVVSGKVVRPQEALLP